MSDKQIILDPTGLYDIPSGYIRITTEVEWIQFFGVSAEPCWVRGERLCKWAETWLRSWNRTEEITEIKQHPRYILGQLFANVPLPHDWTDEQLLILATKLDSYPQDNPIAHFLADNITNSNEQIWFAQASISHLAAWLSIPVPEEYKPLERVWQQRFKEHELANYYQTEDKLLFLRRWLGIAEPVFNDIGKYPLPVPDLLRQEFDSYWEQLISRTEGKVLDTLMPTNQVGMERIANCAYKVLGNRPNWINQAREAKVTPYLSYQQKQELNLNQHPPEPLALNATPGQALAWATKDYLPFRHWEVIKQSAVAPKISDSLADSFVKWMLQHYPQMKVDSVENSYLNYSVASTVQNLCQDSPVFWVVVDGLGWLDHLKLLSLLTNNYKLAVETAIEPRFSILPTKTEYAKWSLYAQLLPNDSAWVADAGKAFVKMGMGKRYTDRQVDKLYSALRKKTSKLYCWDTDIFDSLYHSQKDWQSLYELDRPHALEGIAKRIDYCLQQYPDPDALRIVIASDHGQMMGTSEKITHCPPELEPKGRMAIGKTDDTRFVVLEGDRYGLPHDISIVKGSASLGSFSYTSNKKIIGSHGGLFPEEVVVGVSVLRKSIQRLPVLVFCFGEGKPKQTGELETQQWRDLIFCSMGFNPQYPSYQPEAKTWILARLLPLVEANYHVIELAPKGTGKSFFFENISSKVTLISGGKVTPAQLFINGRTKEVGLLGRHEVLVLDEVQSLTFDNPEEVIGPLKNYFASGRYNRSGFADISSDCGLVMLANIELDDQLEPRNEENLIANLPKFFAETALLDRLCGILPGWKIPKFQREMIASQVGLKMDFFGEVLLSLRQDNRFMFYVEQHTKFAKNVTIRDQNSILKSASGFLKILYPHLELTLMDYERDCLEPACKLRQAIRNSLYYLDDEFRQFGREIYVETK